MWLADGGTLSGETCFIVGMEEYVANERDKKLLLLLRKYGISIDSVDKWKQLAIEMAKEQYEGFTVRNPRTNRNIQHAGRSTVWTQYHLAMLWCDVTLIKVQKGGTDKKALLEITQKSPWRGMLAGTAKRFTAEDWARKAAILNKHLIEAKKLALIVASAKVIQNLPARRRKEEIKRFRADICSHILVVESYRKYPSLLEKLNR